MHLRKKFLNHNYSDLDVKSKAKFRKKFYNHRLTEPIPKFTTSKDGNLKLRNISKVAKKPGQKSGKDIWVKIAPFE